MFLYGLQKLNKQYCPVYPQVHVNFIPRLYITGNNNTYVSVKQVHVRFLIDLIKTLI
jgi:hypothetical protein